MVSLLYALIEIINSLKGNNFLLLTIKSYHEKILAIFAIVIISFAAVGAMMYFSYSNGEITLREGVDAQQEVCKLHFDKMWKIIKQQAQVTDQYKESFQDIYTGLIAGRYDNDDGMFMKWIQESNPDFSPELYKN